VRLCHSRSLGVGHGEGKHALAPAEAYSLSDKDIKTLLPQTRLWSYPDLNALDNAEQMLGRDGSYIALVLTTNKWTGHWICLFTTPGSGISFIDPYGLSPDTEALWLSLAKRRELGEDKPTIMRLLLEQPRPVLISRGHFQRESPNINTCGRWCEARTLQRDKDDAQFAAWVHAMGPDQDASITRYIEAKLGR
jgi:hypothetical protein